MTPHEQLKEIEDKATRLDSHGLVVTTTSEHDWLIARVKKLEIVLGHIMTDKEKIEVVLKTLEGIRNNVGFGGPQNLQAALSKINTLISILTR